jgi:Domain of unknown function (DUF4157)
MESDHRARHAPEPAARTATAELGPGKRTPTEQLAVPRHDVSGTPAADAAAGTRPSAPAPAPSDAARPTLQMLFGVQRAATAAPTEDPAQVHAAAQGGIAGPAGALPHIDQIQSLFGRHDVSQVQAHVGGPAAAASEQMGARAYAAGNHVAFASSPDLHTAAHEAAHVVQQRGGVQLKGGVGAVGDAYERHADQVADAVVQGKSAEPLLDQMSGQGGRAPAVQHVRDKLDDSHISSVTVPDPGMSQYKAHVRMRVTHFFKMVLSAATLYRHSATTPIPRLFTNNAAAQEGNGFRLHGASSLRGDQNFDAAHLMNTTLIPTAFNGTNAPQDSVDELYRASAATTNQFQTSNVSSDKVIDSWQTRTVGGIIGAINGGAAIDVALVNAQLQGFLTSLGADLRARFDPTTPPPPSDKLKYESYKAASEEIDEILNSDFAIVAHDILDEVNAYARTL